LASFGKRETRPLGSFGAIGFAGDRLPKWQLASFGARDSGNRLPKWQLASFGAAGFGDDRLPNWQLASFGTPKSWLSDQLLDTRIHFE
jgi:hypothetical protein